MKTLVVCCIVSLLISCRNEVAPGQSEALYYHFTAVNAVLTEANLVLYEQHEIDLHDPMTKKIVARWEPLFIALHKLQKQTIEKVDQFCEKTKELKTGDFRKTDQAIKKETRKLYLALADFSKEVPTLLDKVDLKNNSKLLEWTTKELGHIQRECFIRLNGGDSAAVGLLSEDDFVHLYFWRDGPSNALTMAQKLKSDVLLTERAVLSYINTSYTKETVIYDTGIPFIQVSKKVARPGDSLSITAMLITALRMDSLQITVNGIPVRINEQGTASQTVTAGQQYGLSRIPITFRYRDIDGRQAYQIQYAEYTIKP